MGANERPAPRPLAPVCLDCRRAKRLHCVLCAAEGVL